MKKCLTVLKISIIIMMFGIVCNNNGFAQSGEKWSLGLNSPTGNYGLGTDNFAPIIFKTNGVSQMWLSPTGNLGIGINNSAYKFDVNGKTHINGFTLLDSNLSVLQNITANTITANSLANNGTKLVTADATGTITPFAFSGQANEVLYGNGLWGLLPTPPQTFWGINGHNIFYTQGSVGIGTNNPLYDLDVTGDVRITNNLYVGGGIVITEKVQANIKVNTASLEADSIIMDSTKAFYGYSNFKGDVTLQNKLDVTGNVGVLGNCKTTGNSQVNGNFVLGSMTGSNGLAYIDSTGTLKIIPGTVTPNPGMPFPAISIAEAWNINGNDNITASHVLGPYNNAPLVVITNGEERMRITESGKIGIGTNNVPNAYTLAIKGKTIASDEVVIQLYTNWPDYAFDKKNKRMNYLEKENYFNINKHLFGVDPANEVEKNGLQLGKNITGIVLNVEENSLDIIDLYKLVKEQQKTIEDLKKEVAKLKKSN